MCIYIYICICDMHYIIIYHIILYYLWLKKPCSCLGSIWCSCLETHTDQDAVVMPWVDMVCMP